MAKTHSNNKQNKNIYKNFNIQYFLIGLILCFMTFIAFFQWGFLGTIYCNFFRLFVGENYPLLLLVLLFAGIWMVLRGQLPIISWRHLLGGGLVFIALSTLSHFNEFAKQEPLTEDILSLTFDIFKNEFLTGQQRISLGGGMLGALFYKTFGYLFGQWGTYLFSAVVFFLGLFILTRIKITEVYQACRILFSQIGGNLQQVSSKVSEISVKNKQAYQEKMERQVIDAETTELKQAPRPAKQNSSLLDRWRSFIDREFNLSMDHSPAETDQEDDDQTYQPAFEETQPYPTETFQASDQMSPWARQRHADQMSDVVLDLDYFDQLSAEQSVSQNTTTNTDANVSDSPIAESSTQSQADEQSVFVSEKKDIINKSEADTMDVKPEPSDESLLQQAGHWQDQAHQRQNLTDDQLENELAAEDQPTTTKGLKKAKTKDQAYQLPGKDLLTQRPPVDQSEEYQKINQNIKKLEQTFQSFGVDARVVKANLGPAVTKYEIEPAIGVKVSKIVSLTDDIALALAARDIRMEAPIPGKSLIGIEVPNSQISPVSFNEIVDAALSSDNLLEVPLGRDVAGAISTADLSKMPHLLIAGSTGSGKSVGMNVIICSLLMKAYPEEVKFLMVDPKKVELTMYNEIPHLLAPVVTNPRKAAKALNQVVEEMERRYERFAETNVRNQESYNEYIEKLNQTEGTGYAKMPKIVVFIDELADLMLVAGNEVENAIIRLAQMARAAGIHMIIATQRPSVDVITGIIKANIPSRLAFAVTSGTDSRTILDANGAEKLLGKGDMLFQPMSLNKPIRVQGAYISDAEVERITNFIKDQREAEYDEEMIISDEKMDAIEASEDEYFEDAVELIKDQETVSISQLQRKFRIGYNRAARLIDDLEALGYIGPADGSKPRQVYLNDFSS
ncbi:DNA segregation ATPase FtsK/SpoIIIE [Ignavigranum ruoffiae]|uniref:DNA segregation ATPase FtsK/SpoIIIE n=1 Tax=Ignavigranum ruoffiae TaxID=89093 RepID=A0A1H8ZPR9_9LACT|nr:DNA segregation ATPase FtsK/SpoIIIE [Ignavigranum ruoffiae]